MPGVSCIRCGDRFYWTEHYGEMVCPRCKAVEFYASAVSSEYTAPECPFNFAAALRENILEEVASHGETRRCTLDIANAFDGWDDAQIDNWCVEHALIMIADFRTNKIVIKLAASRPQGGMQLQRYEGKEARIRAEVEAMDWPEVIDG